MKKKKEDKQTVTEQQNNLITVSSFTRQNSPNIEHMLTHVVSRKQNGQNELRIKLRWVGIRDMQNILVIEQTDLGELCKTIVNMMGAGRK